MLSEFSNDFKQKNIQIHHLLSIIQGQKMNGNTEVNKEQSNMQGAKQNGPVVTFKPTTSSLQSFVHPYNPSETVSEIKAHIEAHYSVEYSQIKLINKGKLLTDAMSAQEAKLENAVVMLVINKNTNQNANKSNSSASQEIPRIPSSFNTGMGNSSPIGFGGYSMINHPQYMSAISGAVNQQNVEEMMNDPSYQGMMEELMNDPDTMKQIIEDNPMLKNMFHQNPAMKAMLDNPAMMKMVFNPETMKMAREMMKKGNNGEGLNGMASQMQGANGTGMPMMGGMGITPNMGGLGGFGGFGGFGGMGNMMNSNLTQNNQSKGSQPNQQQMPFGNPFGMGMGMNPFLMGGNPMFGLAANQVNQANQNSHMGAQTNQQASKPAQSIQQKYKEQMKELQLMGFMDRQQNLKVLIESKGDIDGALERLVKD